MTSSVEGQNYLLPRWPELAGNSPSGEATLLVDQVGMTLLIKSEVKFILTLMFPNM